MKPVALWSGYFNKSGRRSALAVMECIPVSFFPHDAWRKQTCWWLDNTEKQGDTAQWTEKDKQPETEKERGKKREI